MAGYKSPRCSLPPDRTGTIEETPGPPIVWSRSEEVFSELRVMQSSPMAEYWIDDTENGKLDSILIFIILDIYDIVFLRVWG